ncbi:MAG: hypothetical protein ACRDPO_24280 [Streptosporangiaceae bacterium]
MRKNDVPGTNTTSPLPQPDGYVIPGQLLATWAAIGPDHSSAADKIKHASFDLQCGGPGHTTISRSTKPSGVIRVPGNTSQLNQEPWPTLFPQAVITIPSKCEASRNGTTGGPDPTANSVIYFCWIGVSPKTNRECESTYVGIVPRGTKLPGIGLPSKSKRATMYEWVTKKELKFIKAHGHFLPPSNHIGEYFYPTEDDAYNAQTLYKGYTLVKASITGAEVEVDYTVTIDGIDSGFAYYMNSSSINAFFDILEVGS